MAIASHLSSRVQAHFFSSKVCARFAYESGAFHSVKAIEFNKPSTASVEIAQMDAIVSVNTTRFHEIICSQSKPHFFLDTLAWARPVSLALLDDVEAYYIQSFFEHPHNSPDWKNEKVQEVGVVRQCGSRSREPQGDHALVHLGGLTSPVIPDEVCREFVQRTLELLKYCPGKITLLLPPHFQHVAKPSHICIKSCALSELSGLFEQSAVSITTPGIEHVYESIFHGAPTYLLPPFNSTQVLQTRYFKRSLPGMVLYNDIEDFDSVDFGNLVDAAHQTHQVALGGTWEKMFNQLERKMPGVLDRINSARNSKLLELQQGAVSSISVNGAFRIAQDIEQRLDSDNDVTSTVH
ncbi:hypothetical protein [Rhodovulum sulfidophilum]|uniref:hypothetical protein n=1 Tax=Rhodovulum sulfidophilum TaxID=35806 RepID=UPI001389F459|nr:hypothetical protein [Rhodovulum sulfidophilum]NDK33274.1 hypothetical protein [Rhodovulum sulfidophilum]